MAITVRPLPLSASMSSGFWAGLMKDTSTPPALLRSSSAIVGSFTFKTMSDPQAVAVSTMTAPDALYAASVYEARAPAPLSTFTA